MVNVLFVRLSETEKGIEHEMVDVC